MHSYICMSHTSHKSKILHSLIIHLLKMERGLDWDKTAFTLIKWRIHDNVIVTSCTNEPACEAPYPSDILKVRCSSVETNLLSFVGDDNSFLIFSIHIHKKLISLLETKWYLYYQSTLRKSPKNNFLRIKMKRIILLHQKQANQRKIFRHGRILECN